LLKRSLLLSLTIGLIVTATSTRLQAQDYPNRDIKLIVGFPAGGSSDTQARILAEKLSPILGQRVIVENRGGANGAIATRAVAKAEKDGYTLTLNGSEFPLNLLGMKEPGYSVDDFTIIGALAYSPVVLIANSRTTKSKNFKEFAAYAKANPGKITYATFGPQSISSLVANRFKEAAGIDWREVPYKGAPQIVQDMLSGNVDSYWGLTTVASQLNGQPDIVLLGLADTKRNARLPDVPTFVEQGVSNFVEFSPTGIWVPAGTPQPIVDKLRKAVEEVRKMQDVKDLLGKSGNAILDMTPAQYDKDIRDSIAKYAAEFKKLGIQPE
jgi:tripartite-type tricarboxylate transporter receptor subunit TctC